MNVDLFGSTKPLKKTQRGVFAQDFEKIDTRIDAKELAKAGKAIKGLIKPSAKQRYDFHKAKLEHELEEKKYRIKLAQVKKERLEIGETDRPIRTGVRKFFGFK